jgi:hypothetical protein
MKCKINYLVKSRDPFELIRGCTCQVEVAVTTVNLTCSSTSSKQTAFHSSGIQRCANNNGFQLKNERRSEIRRRIDVTQRCVNWITLLLNIQCASTRWGTSYFFFLWFLEGEDIKRGHKNEWVSH